MPDRPAIVLALALSALPSSRVLGQTPSPSTAVDIKTLPQRFVADEWLIWTSPFHRKNYSSRTMTRYVLPFGLLSGALIATDRKTAGVLPNSKDQTIWSGRVSQLGASYSLAGMSGGTYLIGKLVHNAHAQETGLLGLEALGHTQIAVFAFKQLTNRERPLDNDRRGGFWERGTSFPSGHAASSFAVATVFAYEYRSHIAVPIAAYSLAGIVSASRAGAQRHWISDVVVGSSLGFLIGRYTYKRHHDPGLSETRHTRLQRCIPQVGLGAATITLSWKL